MKRDILWSAGLLVIFIVFPMWLVSTEPSDAPLRSWWAFALATLGVVVFVAGAILMVIVLAMSLPRGLLRSVAQIERRQTLTAVVFSSLVITLALVMSTTYAAIAGLYAALGLAYGLWCLPMSARRLQLRLEVLVRCSPEAAFALVSDPRNWHSYFSQIEVEEPLDQPVRLGSTVSYIWREGTLAYRDDEVVIAFEPGRRFGTASKHRRPTDAVYEMSAIDDGTEIAFTHLSVMTYGQALLGGLLRRGAIVRRATERRWAAMTEIKRLLETRVPVSV